LKPILGGKKKETGSSAHIHTERIQHSSGKGESKTNSKNKVVFSTSEKQKW
jgi:hypothetical protein